MKQDNPANLERENERRGVITGLPSIAGYTHITTYKALLSYMLQNFS